MVIFPVGFSGWKFPLQISPLFSAGKPEMCNTTATCNSSSKVENNETLVELFDSIKVDPSFVQDIFEFPPSLCPSSISKSPSCISLCTTFSITRPGLSIILKKKMKLLKKYHGRYLKNTQIPPRNILSNLQDYFCQQSPLKCMQFYFSVTTKKTKKAFSMRKYFAQFDIT